MVSAGEDRGKKCRETIDYIDGSIEGSIEGNIEGILWKSHSNLEEVQK